MTLKMKLSAMMYREAVICYDTMFVCTYTQYTSTFFFFLAVHVDNQLKTYILLISLIWSAKDSSENPGIVLTNAI